MWRRFGVILATFAFWGACSGTTPGEKNGSGDDVRGADSGIAEGCVPNCEGLECGADGCGGSCGECDEGVLCAEGICTPPPCTPDEPCDDGDSCTYDDACEDGVCGGTPYACDDEKVCTTDSCDGLGDWVSNRGS